MYGLIFHEEAIYPFPRVEGSEILSQLQSKLLVIELPFEEKPAQTTLREVIVIGQLFDALDPFSVESIAGGSRIKVIVDGSKILPYPDSVTKIVETLLSLN